MAGSPSPGPESALLSAHQRHHLGHGSTPASLGWCQPQLDSLLAFVGRKHSKSFLMLKDGRLVVEQYYGTYTADSIHYWASAGKSLTATLVGLAQQDGILSINDSTSKYLGRWTSASRPQQRQILLRHQLTMTTGLDDTPPTPCTNESTTPNCLRYLAPPATRWAYHTGAYRTLQNVLVQASGAPLSSTLYTTAAAGQPPRHGGVSGSSILRVLQPRPRHGPFRPVYPRQRQHGTARPSSPTPPIFRQMTHPLAKP